MGKNLCRSCNQVFETDNSWHRWCPRCIGYKQTVRPAMVELYKQAVTAAARALVRQVWSNFDQGKYLAAVNHIEELRLQIEEDRREFVSAGQRKKEKSARWHARQNERRSRDQELRSKMRGRG